MFKRLIAIFTSLLIGTAAYGQEKPAIKPSVEVDFAYGLPFYFGDFNTLLGNPAPYRNNNLTNPRVYNKSSFSTAIAFPLNNRFAIRLFLNQTSLTFEEPGVQVYFRNSAFSMIPQAKFDIVDQRLKWYVHAGAGISWSRESDVQANPDSLLNTSRSPRIARLALAGGTGIQFRVWKEIHVFSEWNFMTTGTDRFDGYNGPVSGNPFQEVPDEKPYFQRDQLMDVRLGIRFPLLKDLKNVEERPYGRPISNVDPDPDFDEYYWLKDPDRRQLTDKERIYRALRIKTKLSDYTIKAGYALTLDELMRLHSVAERIARQLSNSRRGLEVLVLEEKQGYTIHFGTFKRYQEAKDWVDPLRNFYREVKVQYNGK